MGLAELSTHAAAAVIAMLGEGRTATIGSAAAVDCIFDGPFERQLAGGMGLESYAPQVTVLSPTSAGHRDTVVVKNSAGGTIGTYYVHSVQPETEAGSGLTILILTED